MEKRSCEIKVLDKKLCAKRGLYSKNNKKQLTIEQQLENLKVEKENWGNVKNNIVDKVSKLFNAMDMQEDLLSIFNDKKQKDNDPLKVYKPIFDAINEVDENLEQKEKDLLNQLPPNRRWEWDWKELQEQKAKWEEDYQRMLIETEEHYKNNKGGGIYYRWLDDDDYHMREYFKEQEQELRERNFKLYQEKIKTQKKNIEEQTK